MRPSCVVSSTLWKFRGTHSSSISQENLRRSSGQSLRRLNQPPAETPKDPHFVTKRLLQAWLCSAEVSCRSFKPAVSSSDARRWDVSSGFKSGAVSWFFAKPAARLSSRGILLSGMEAMNLSKLAEENQWPRSDSDTSQGRPLQPWQTPLTGRDTELSLLKDRWEQAQEGMGQVVLVIGEAGLGKSRLVQTLVQSVQEKGSDIAMERDEQRADRTGDGPILIDWRCSEDFQNSELYPVTDYLERFIDAGPEGDAADRFERLARHLEDCGLGRPR